MPARHGGKRHQQAATARALSERQRPAPAAAGSERRLPAEARVSATNGERRVRAAAAGGKRKPESCGGMRQRQAEGGTRSGKLWHLTASAGGACNRQGHAAPASGSGRELLYPDMAGDVHESRPAGAVSDDCGRPRQPDERDGWEEEEEEVVGGEV